jgi:phosphinothricin acetyltransferase
MKETVRSGRPEDLSQLTELYNHYVRETPITFDVEPFTPETRRPWFDQFSETGRHRLLVAEEDGRIVGYASSSRLRPKPAYLTSVEVTAYLLPDLQGRGLGSRLYTELFAALVGEDVHRAYAGVTIPNDGSIALHKKFGFQSIGIYREVGRKFGRYWDVEWFEKGFPE